MKYFVSKRLLLQGVCPITADHLFFFFSLWLIGILQQASLEKGLPCKR